MVVMQFCFHAIYFVATQFDVVVRHDIVVRNSFCNSFCCHTIYLLSCNLFFSDSDS